MDKSCIKKLLTYLFISYVLQQLSRKRTLPFDLILRLQLLSVWTSGPRDLFTSSDYTLTPDYPRRYLTSLVSE